MRRCEDFPCCGHLAGECPDEKGNHYCSCGAMLPKKSRFSICNGCLRRESKREDELGDYDYD